MALSVQGFVEREPREEYGRYLAGATTSDGSRQILPDKEMGSDGVVGEYSVALMPDEGSARTTCLVGERVVLKPDVQVWLPTVEVRCVVAVVKCLAEERHELPPLHDAVRAPR